METTSAHSFFRKLGNGSPVEMTDSTPECYVSGQFSLPSSPLQLFDRH